MLFPLADFIVSEVYARILYYWYLREMHDCSRLQQICSCILTKNIDMKIIFSSSFSGRASHFLFSQTEPASCTDDINKANTRCLCIIVRMTKLNPMSTVELFFFNCFFFENLIEILILWLWYANNPAGSWWQVMVLNKDIFCKR